MPDRKECARERRPRQEESIREGETYEALGFGSVVTGFPFLSRFGFAAPAFAPRRGGAISFVSGARPSAVAADGVDEVEREDSRFSRWIAWANLDGFFEGSVE